MHVLSVKFKNVWKCTFFFLNLPLLHISCYLMLNKSVVFLKCLLNLSLLLNRSVVNSFQTTCENNKSFSESAASFGWRHSEEENRVGSRWVSATGAQLRTWTDKMWLPFINIYLLLYYIVNVVHVHASKDVDPDIYTTYFWMRVMLACRNIDVFCFRIECFYFEIVYNLV